MTSAKAKVPISTLIVDDEELARNLIGSFVRRDPDLLLVGECSNGSKALEAIARQQPELVFLDIQMPVLNGISVAEQLAAADHVPYIIFVTAYDDYAIKAFELDVLDYLVKPIEKARFRAAVERAKEAIRNKEIVRLTERLLEINGSRAAQAGDADKRSELIVKSGRSIVQIATDDIVWIEAANQYAHIHTNDHTFTVSESLSQYMKKITDRRFIRVHRSAVVNGGSVVAVTRNRNGTHKLRLRNGKEIILARSRSHLVPTILRMARRGEAGYA